MPKFPLFVISVDGLDKEVWNDDMEKGVADMEGVTEREDTGFFFCENKTLVDGLLGLLVLVLLDNFNNEVMDQILPENRDCVSDSDSGTERGDRDTGFFRFCCQLFFIICDVDF